MMHGYLNVSSTKILQACTIIRKLKTGTRGLNVSFQLERLDSRGLIRVRGADVISFMQGIVTNDMKHLQDRQSLFTMFLNTKGRVLYDAIIYKQKEDNAIFIECDRQCLDDLIKHLKMYRIRRKIDIDSIDDEMKLWVGFRPDVEFENKSGDSVKQEQIVPCSSPVLDSGKSGYSYLDDMILGDNTTVYSDPRIPVLGKRIITPANEDLSSYLNSAGVKLITSPVSYRMFRYRLGVGEGIEELPIGKCFPLEANCDYLHGVSFHKGCYIGQELTARTHHTGVVRKRLMPLLLQSEVSQVSNDLPIEDSLGEQKRPIGKLRGAEKNSGLGLMRIAEALNASRLKVGDVEGETTKPFWWPQEITKERSDTGTK